MNFETFNPTQFSTLPIEPNTNTALDEKEDLAKATDNALAHENCNHYHETTKFSHTELLNNQEVGVGLSAHQHGDCSHDHGGEVTPFISQEEHTHFHLPGESHEHKHEHDHKHCPKCDGELEGFFFCKECKRRWID